MDTPVDWSPLDGLDALDALDAAAAPQLESETFTSTSTYDALDRPLTTTAPDASVTAFVWNEGGLVESIGVALRGSRTPTSFVDEIDYDAQGRRTRIGYANGVTTTHEYDADTFRLVRMRSTRTSDGAALQDLRYTYDPVGNIADITDASQQTLFFANTVAEPTTRYEYDPIYRLIGASGREHASVGQPTHEEPPYGTIPHPNDGAAVRPYAERYVYDEVGNFVEMQHAHDGGLDAEGRIVPGATIWRRRYDTASHSNRLLATSLPGDADGTYSAGYEYDVRGSMTRMPHLPLIEPDFRDQARRVELPDGEVIYHYDGAGQRFRKVARTGGTTRETLYLGGWERYRESVGASVSLERETLHVMDDRQRVALVETKTIDESGSVAAPEPLQRFQLANHLGSSAVEVDETGAVISFEQYHPYGTTAWWAGASIVEVSSKRYRYTGMEKDDETGLSSHGARLYATWLARWTSADPSGMQDGPNRYAYVSGNPISLMDPIGRGGVAGPIGGPPAPLPDPTLMEVAVQAATAAYATLPDVEHVYLPDAKGLIENFKPVFPLVVAGARSGMATATGLTQAGLAAAGTELGLTGAAAVGAAGATGLVGAAGGIAGFGGLVALDEAVTLPVMEGQFSAAGTGWSLAFDYASQHGVLATVGVLTGLTSPLPDDDDPQVLDVGPYRDFTPGPTGDGLTPDHIPSNASLKKAEELALGAPLSDAEKRQVTYSGICIVVPGSVHAEFSLTYGGRNNASQILADAQDPKGAAIRDAAAMGAALRHAGYDPVAIDAAFEELHQQNAAAGLYTWP